MNRLILKYGYPLAAIILAVFVWVVSSRISRGWSEVVPLAVAAIVVWVIGTPTFLYLWPRLTVGGFRRAILKRGIGDGPIPVNTLRASPTTSSPSAPRSLLSAGTDDVVYLAGWLELKDGPLVLHVPEMADRYFSLQFTDPSTSANFAYVGTRATGTRAGDYLLTGPDWIGSAPSGMPWISSPRNSVLVIGRVFVADDSDRPTASALAQQIRLTSLASPSSEYL